jgi:probable rRNA maturation factor
MITCSVSHQSELDLPFSEDGLRCILQKILHHSEFSDIPRPALISLVFIDDAEMREMNHQYRKIDNTTDVLSFEINEDTPEGYLLGELIISLPKATRDAMDLHIPFQDEVIRLIVHGFAHLLGFDHVTDEQENEMREIEYGFFQLYCPMEEYSLYG